MRELSLQEMDQVSGAIIPAIAGVALAFGSLVVTHKAAATAIGVVGLLVAVYSLSQTQSNSCVAE